MFPCLTWYVFYPLLCMVQQYGSTLHVADESNPGSSPGLGVTWRHPAILPSCHPAVLPSCRPAVHVLSRYSAVPRYALVAGVTNKSHMVSAIRSRQTVMNLASNMFPPLIVGGRFTLLL